MNTCHHCHRLINGKGKHKPTRAKYCRKCKLKGIK